MIFVTGGTFKQRQLTYDLVEFAWKKLMPRIVNCEINVELKNMAVYEGTCIDTDVRQYEIEISKSLTGDNFITTIFHEMVHVKQYVRKELFSECNFYKTRDEYLNLPWEIEAYKTQETLLEEWYGRN
jgi:hypothetical protein|tara:strand:+ start:511 stop:891 length:381 start_codon:yes stop_codon:yes gene_type:complete